MRAVSEAANAVEAPKMEAAGVPELGNLTEEERAARIRALRVLRMMKNVARSQR